VAKELFNTNNKTLKKSLETLLANLNSAYTDLQIFASNSANRSALKILY